MKAVCACGQQFTASAYRLDAIGPLCWDCYVADRLTSEAGCGLQIDEAFEAIPDAISVLNSARSSSKINDDLASSK